MTIVEEIKNDKERGARRLESEYKAKLMSVARRCCADESEAEELVYAVFAAVIERIDDYREDAAFFNWMCKILLYCRSADTRRKSNKTVVYTSKLPDVPNNGAECVFESVDAAILRDAVDELPKPMKDAIILHYFMELPLKQIAQLTMSPIGTVMSRLYYARAVLAKRLVAKLKKTGASAAIAMMLFLAATAATVAVTVVTRNGAQKASVDGEHAGAAAINCEPAAEVAQERDPPDAVAQKYELPDAVAINCDPSVTVAQERDPPDIETTNYTNQEGEEAMNLKNAVAAPAVAVAMAVASPVAASATTWTGGTASLENGKIAITCDASGNVASIVATPADGETLTLDGADVVFADGASVTLAQPGALAFAKKATSLGRLNLTRGDGAYKAWTTASAINNATYTYDAFDQAFKYNDAGDPWPDDWTDNWVLDAVANTNGVAPGKFVYSGRDQEQASRFHLNRTAAGYVYTLGVQLSRHNDDGWLYARYWKGAVRSPRFGLFPSLEGGWETEDLYAKWRNAPAAGDPDDEKAAYAARGYYGSMENTADAGAGKLGEPDALKIFKLILRRKDAGAAAVRFEGGVSFGGETTVCAGLEAVLAASEGDGGVVLRQPVSGDGDVKIVAQPPKNVSKSESDFASGEYDLKEYLMPESLNGWRNTIWNRDVSKMTGCSAVMTLDNDKDHSSVNYPNVTCVTNHFKYHPEDNTVTCQFECKISSTYAGRIRVKFRQRGAHIQAAVTGAGYLSGTAGSLGEMTSTGNRDILYKTNFTDSVFCDTKNFPSNPQCFGIHSIRAFFEGEEGGMSGGGRAAVEGDMSGLVGGTLSFEGGDWPLDVTVSNTNSFPACGNVDVATNATMLLDVRSIVNVQTGVSGGTSTLKILEGGELRASYTGQIGVKQRVVADGGRFVLDTWERYVNDLTLNKGASVDSTTNTFRMHATGAPHQMLVAAGTNPCALAGGVRLYGGAETDIGNNPCLRVDVRDEGGSLSLGPVFYSDASHCWYGLEKYGLGTLVLNDTAKNIRLPSKVCGGALKLAASGVATNAIVLAGGELAAGAFTTNSLGTLSVTAEGGSIRMEEGCVLEFADSHAETWVPEKIFIYGFAEKSLKFGSSKEGLTKDQRKQLRAYDPQDPEGARVYALSSGFLSLHGPALAIIFK